MMKGAKKAIVRAPHRFTGSKSTEDRIIIEWTKDFTTAEAALDLIVSETKQFIKSWKELCQSQDAIVNIFSDIYKPILEENLYKSVQETPQSSTLAISSLGESLEHIKVQVMPVLDHLENQFVSNCKGCKECIEAVQKALKKREHKKMDFDRHSNSVEKLSKKQELTEKDQQHMTKLEIELEQAMEIFYAQDAKCKEYIPLVLTSISEFLNPMTATLYLAQLRVFEIFKTELFNYAQAQGLLGSTTSLAHEVGSEQSHHQHEQHYDIIAEEWETRFLHIQPQCEQGIKSLREGETIKRPMDMPSERKREKVKSAFDTTMGKSSDLAHKAIHRAKHPKVSNIQFASSSHGLFRSEADILASVANGSNSVTSSPTLSQQPRRSTSSSSTFTSSSFGGGNNYHGHQPPLHSHFHSPILSGNSGFEHHADLSTITRVRALSSSSARALSPLPNPGDSQLSPYAIKAKSESDEYAIALHTFLGDAPGDVAFRAGDKIRVLDHGDETDDMWWFGETKDGRLGLFPCNYVSSDKGAVDKGTGLKGVV